MSPPSGHESPPLHEVHFNKLIVQFCISKLRVQAFKVSQCNLYFIGSSPEHTSCFTQLRERQDRSSFVHAFNFADERINSELSHRANYKIKRAIRPKKILRDIKRHAIHICCTWEFVVVTREVGTQMLFSFVQIHLTLVTAH